MRLQTGDAMQIARQNAEFAADAPVADAAGAMSGVATFRDNVRKPPKITRAIFSPLEPRPLARGLR